MNIRKLLLFALPFSMLLAGCDKDNTENEGNQTPDPEGTITINISDNSYQTVNLSWRGNFCPNTADGTNALYIRWGSPDNIGVGGSTTSGEYENTIYIYTSSAELVNIGPVAGLGNVSGLPTSGWGNNFACETGHGYIIRMKAKSERKLAQEWIYIQPGDTDYWEETVYARLYVVEPIVSTVGGIMGAKVKYQFPFIP